MVKIIFTLAPMAVRSTGHRGRGEAIQGRTGRGSTAPAPVRGRLRWRCDWIPTCPRREHPSLPATANALAPASKRD